LRDREVTMKIWTSEHIFEHPWEEVVQGALRKYPNPFNSSVKGLDVVERKVDSDGVLRTHRLMSTCWNLPSWSSAILGGLNRMCYGSEHSEINPLKKIMKLRTRNLTFSNVITIEEHLSYEANPHNPKTTLMKQESVITVKGVPLGSYLEGLVEGTCSSNAVNGRQAMEWAIGKIKQETLELSRKVEESMEDFNRAAQSAQKNMEGLSRKAIEDMENIMPPPKTTSSL
jgi:hypothetical protein